MQKEILIAVGSNRKGSFNKQFANYIKEELENQGLKVSFLDYKNLPILEQDTEYPTPNEVKLVRDKVEKAAGLWIVTPEYNGSYPAIVKNLLDWLSRPAKPFDFETPTVLANKKTTVAAVAGSTVAKFVRKNVTDLLKYIRTDVFQGEGLGISLPAEAWQTGELVLSDEQKNQVKEYVKQFISFLG